MTTVAWDGKTLAADSQSQSSYVRVGSTKKIFIKGGKVYGASGTLSRVNAFIDKGEKLSEDDTVFEICTKTGKCLEHYASGIIESAPPVALGSGCEIAMGAMMAGADAVQAVKIAIKLDPNSGGKIQSKRVK